MEKYSAIAGGLILAVLIGIGLNAAFEISSDSFKTKLKNQESVFEKLSKSRNKIPEFLSEKEYQFVMKSNVIDISKVTLTSEVSYLIFFDKVYLSYLIGLMGDSQKEFKDGITEYPHESIFPIDYVKAKEIYDKVSEDYLTGIGNPKKAYLKNPNSKKEEIQNSMKMLSFLLKSEESKDVFLKGLDDYYKFLTLPEQQEEMMKNPSVELCALIDVLPELKGLPKEYCSP